MSLLIIVILLFLFGPLILGVIGFILWAIGFAIGFFASCFLGCIGYILGVK